MARYAGVHRLPPIDYRNVNKDSAHDKAFDALLETSNTLPEGKVVGAMLKFQVMDNFAWYLVTKERPFTVKLVDHWDGYEIRDAELRGLTKADALYQLEARRSFSAMISKEYGSHK